MDWHDTNAVSGKTSIRAKTLSVGPGSPSLKRSGFRVHGTGMVE